MLCFCYSQQKLEFESFLERIILFNFINLISYKITSVKILIIKFLKATMILLFNGCDFFEMILTQPFNEVK
jgi:hypothetical protein